MTTKPTIPMCECKSSQVKAFGHDPATNTLAVEFNSGVYHYAGVPAEVFEEMKKAESVGRFLGQSIKGKFEFSKVQPEEKE
ncbi:MAG: KTSC domain-containing protein [Propionivibrio sp.]|nr:KTSC domain-containing protein [Propionivibrio sp.]